MINKLINTVMEVCGVQSLSGRSYRQVCAKSIIYHELKKKGYRTSHIARIMGEDHASVFNLLKKYDDRLEYDEEFRCLVEQFNKSKRSMTLKEYQEQAMTTCMKSSENFSYMFLNLVGEVGELASKVAKGIRKGNMYIGEGENDNALYYTDFPEMVEQENEMMKEAGDILWQLSGLCSVMGWSLERIAEINLEKLSSRQKRNVIDGNGDNR